MIFCPFEIHPIPHSWLFYISRKFPWIYRSKLQWYSQSPQFIYSYTMALFAPYTQYKLDCSKQYHEEYIFANKKLICCWSSDYRIPLCNSHTLNYWWHYLINKHIYQTTISFRNIKFFYGLLYNFSHLSTSINLASLGYFSRVDHST